MSASGQYFREQNRPGIIKGGNAVLAVGITIRR
jgi:hypothetical protein